MAILAATAGIRITAASSRLSSAGYQLVGAAGEQRCRYQLALFFACNEGVRCEQKIQAWHALPTTETAISLRNESCTLPLRTAAKTSHEAK